MKRKQTGQKGHSLIARRFIPQFIGPQFDDERTFENDDEQFDPIKTLLVHEPKTLHNHFSKDTVATSVNDVIAVNVMNMGLQRWITTTQDMNMIVDMINLLLGTRPNMRGDIFEDWLIWMPRLPNRDTALTNHNTLWCSKPIQELNGRQARQSHFLSKRPN